MCALVIFQQSFNFLLNVHLYFDVSFSNSCTYWFKTGFQVYTKHYSMKELFAQFKELVYYLAYSQWLCIKLAPSSIGISFMMRLFVGLISINPVFLLISVCISLVLYMALSFKASYSYLLAMYSIF